MAFRSCRATELPPVHRDPADRFAIATALVCGLAEGSADARLADHRIATLCCRVGATRKNAPLTPWSYYDHTMYMIRTSVAELRARLSHFLRLVREGETVAVESHRHPVALLVPSSDAASRLVIPAERPVSELRRLSGVRIPPGVDPLGHLMADRRSR